MVKSAVVQAFSARECLACPGKIGGREHNENVYVGTSHILVSWNVQKYEIRGEDLMKQNFGEMQVMIIFV